MKTRISTILLGAIGICMLTVYLSGCKKTDIAVGTTTDVNIVGYLDKHLDSFSLFRQILERTETSAYLNAYGAYTCFAVTNSGVQAYLSKIGAANVDAAPLPTLKDMVKLHLLEDTITTAAFTDGKLPVITMYGQYLTTGVTMKYGVSSYLINKQGFVLQRDIKTGNGMIHVIDNVLTPATLSLAKQLEANPEYSIFLQAVKETGYYDLLNTTNNPDVNKRFLTVIAESNTALADSTIPSYAALKAKYAQNANLTSDTNRLNMYVAYHILYGIKFLADIKISQSHTTLAPQEVISSKLDTLNPLDVILNEDEFNGVVERGIFIKRLNSDVQATNGVLHEAAAHFSVKFRNPTAVYWDVSDFPEIRKLTAFFRRANYAFSKPTAADEPIKDISWPLPRNVTTSTMNYVANSGTITNGASFNDVNKMILGAPDRPLYIDYKTPVIIKGKYKVWMCYRQQTTSSSSQNQCNVIIDGETMQRTFNFVTVRPSGTDADLESINFKRYTERTENYWVGRLVGIVDIKTTERHTIRIHTIVGTQNDNNLDMVHFIPINENQVLPRFKVDGSKLFQ
jgi:uncharacterized surface protein with fasciclin (FAS1) repeats